METIEKSPFGSSGAAQTRCAGSRLLNGTITAVSLMPRGAYEVDPMPYASFVLDAAWGFTFRGVAQCQICTAGAFPAATPIFRDDWTNGGAGNSVQPVTAGETAQLI